MNIQDIMLGPKEGRVQVMDRVPRKLNSVDQLARLWKDSNTSNDSQANPSIGGYMNLAGETAWSLNTDSAASMFPPAPGWEEDYQDLSLYCQTTQQLMPSAMADVRKSASLIVQDDELNTPEIRDQDFDYTRRDNVFSRFDTSPVSLFDDGLWELPSTIDNTHTTVKTECDESEEVSKEVTTKEISDQPSARIEHLGAGYEVFNDGDMIPTVIHEEEVESTHEEDIIAIDISEAEVEMKPELNTYDIELMDSSLKENTSNMITVIEPVTNVVMKHSLESLLVDAAKSGNLNADITLQTLSLVGDENVETISVQDSDTVKEDPESCDQIYVTVDNTQMSTEGQVTLVKDQGSSVLNDAVWSDIPTMGKFGAKSNLKLNLMPGTGLFEDTISTPVLMRTLLGDDLDPTSSSFRILDIVEKDPEEIKAELMEVASTVDFSDVTAVPTSSTYNSNTLIEEQSASTEKILNVVIKKSADGQLSVYQKQDSEEDEEVSNARSGKRAVSRKRLTMKRGTKKIQEKLVDKTSSVLKGNFEKLRTSKRKISEGRSPVKEELPSTSRGNLSTRPKRQRKISYSSDYDDDDVYSPPSKRSRQSSVESGDGKYRELRDRNNEASRKSRLNRKAKEQDMKKTAERLEKENQSLKVRAEEMEKLVKKLRQSLLETVMQSKK